MVKLASPLFHVHLTVKVSAAGMHVGRVTPEPLLEEEAVKIKDAYAASILDADSVTLAAVEYGKNDTLVFPVDVLRRSVLLFQLAQFIEPMPPGQELDFGQNKKQDQVLDLGVHRKQGKSRLPVNKDI